MAQQQQPQKSSLLEQYAVARGLMELSALTVLPFCRVSLGYRLMNPLRLLAVNAFLVIVSAFAQQGHADSNPGFLMVFALASFALAIVARIKAWWNLHRGVRQHSYFIGTSILNTFTWMPGCIQKNRRCERFVDPAIIFFIGWALHSISPALSVWLCLSALSLRHLEFSVQQKYLHLDLDTLDGMIMAERQGQTIEQFENTKGSGQKQPSTGVATGLGPDLLHKVKGKEKHNPQLN